MEGINAKQTESEGERQKPDDFTQRCKLKKQSKGIDNAQ